jgi:hypothetical protein
VRCLSTSHRGTVEIKSAKLVLTTSYGTATPVVTTIDFSGIEACRVAILAILESEKWDRERAQAEMNEANANRTAPSGISTVLNRMGPLLRDIRHNPMLWLLSFVPAAFVAAQLRPEAHTLLFVLSVLAIVPLATLLSHATEAVAAKTGDATGGSLTRRSETSPSL